MARAKWLSIEEKESIMEMRAGGMTAAQIASKMERGVKSIQRVLNAKEDKPVQQANVMSAPASVGLPANVTHQQAPAPTMALASYPMLANVMEMRAGGFAAAQMASMMQTGVQPAPHYTVVREAAPRVLAPRQQEFVRMFAPRSPPVPMAQVAPERAPATANVKVSSPPKTAKRPQVPRPSAKKSSPKTTASKSQPTEGPPPSGVQESSSHEPPHAATEPAHSNPQPSAQPTATTGVPITSALGYQQARVIGGQHTATKVHPYPQNNESAATSRPPPNDVIANADVEMSSGHMPQSARDTVSTDRLQHGVESMVNIIPDDDSDEDEEDKISPQPQGHVLMRESPARQTCVRRPPRINDALAVTSNRDSPSLSGASASPHPVRIDHVEPQTHEVSVGAPNEMLRGFEAELESSQVQTQTPPTSQIEPEPCVTKKRKIDDSGAVKQNEDPISHTMALLAKAVEDSLASSKAGLPEKRLALLFQRFQVDVQLLQLEQQCEKGPTSWQL